MKNSALLRALASSGAPVSTRAHPRELRVGLWLLLLFTAYLVVRATQLTVFDDEALITLVAARDDPADTIREFLTATGRHTHPPLYDLLLHEWIRVGGGTLPFLRLPSILFYSAALWMITAVAAMRGMRRDVAMLVAIAWPPGPFLGVPAHWSSLAMLGIAGMTLCSLRWRQAHRTRDVVGFTAFAILLLYTSYVAVPIALALACLALAAGIPKHQRRPMAIAFAVIAALSLPLLRPIYHEIQAGPPVVQAPLALLAQGVYRLYTLLAGETIAPWSPPAIPLLLGAAGLLLSGIRMRRLPVFFDLLAIIYIPAAVAGLVDGKRLGLFAPWFVLGLIESIHLARPRRFALACLSLVFGIAWLGVFLPRWTATYRYIEPWRDVVDESIRQASPGATVICNHASFYYYAHDRLNWDTWPDPYVRDVFSASGFLFSSVFKWREAVPGRRDIVYVRSVMPPDVMEEDRDLLAYLDEHALQLSDTRYLRDPGSRLKNLVVGNQPEWRIEIRRFQMRESAGPDPAAIDPVGGAK